MGDHQNKPDVGVPMARNWYDTGVRAIFDIGITTRRALSSFLSNPRPDAGLKFLRNGRSQRGRCADRLSALR